MWLLLGKIFLVALPIWCARDLYKYYTALKSWTPAKGIIIRRKPSSRNVYLVIKFQPADGKEIEFDSDGFILFLDLFYSKGEEVDILYPPDTPDKYRVRSRMLEGVLPASEILIAASSRRTAAENVADKAE